MYDLKCFITMVVQNDKAEKKGKKPKGENSAAKKPKSNKPATDKTSKAADGKKRPIKSTDEPPKVCFVKFLIALNSCLYFQKRLKKSKDYEVLSTTYDESILAFGQNATGVDSTRDASGYVDDEDMEE